MVGGVVDVVVAVGLRDVGAAFIAVVVEFVVVFARVLVGVAGATIEA